MLLQALQFSCSPSSWLQWLFSLEEEQFICSKRRLFCLVHSDSQNLSECTSCCIFLDSAHLYCYSIVDAIAVLLVILLTDSFHIKLAYLALFRLYGKILHFTLYVKQLNWFKCDHVFFLISIQALHTEKTKN